MKILLFSLAGLWMAFAGLRYGWKFIRQYGNYLLGLEWIIMGSSSLNYLVWSLTGASPTNPQALGVYFLDSFSRSVGLTLMMVMGLMGATHRYKPSLVVDVGVFGLGTVAGLYLMGFETMPGLHVRPASIFVAANVLTTLFLVYFSIRLWKIGAKSLAAWAGVATAAGFVTALCYDFFPWTFDDAPRAGTLFAIYALTTWGTQLFVYYLAYRALHNHKVASEGNRGPRLQTAGPATP